MDGKLSYRGIRSGRDMGECELNSSTRAKEPTGRDGLGVMPRSGKDGAA